MTKLLDQGFYYQHCIPGENEAVVKYYETSERLRVALKCGVYISRYCVQWRLFSNCYWVQVKGRRPTFVSFTKVSGMRIYKIYPDFLHVGLENKTKKLIARHSSIHEHKNNKPSSDTPSPQWEEWGKELAKL